MKRFNSVSAVMVLLLLAAFPAVAQHNEAISPHHATTPHGEILLGVFSLEKIKALHEDLFDDGCFERIIQMYLIQAYIQGEGKKGSPPESVGKMVVH